MNTSVCVQGGTGSGRTQTACSSDEVSVAPLHTSCANQICLHDKQRTMIKTQHMQHSHQTMCIHNEHATNWSSKIKYIEYGMRPVP